MVCYLLLLQAVLCPARTIKHNCSAMSVTLEKKDHMSQRMFHNINLLDQSYPEMNMYTIYKL